jgi:hypothetical protein
MAGDATGSRIAVRPADPIPLPIRRHGFHVRYPD